MGASNRAAHGLQDPELIRKQVRKNMQFMSTPQKLRSNTQSPMKITEVQSRESSLRSKTRQQLGMEPDQGRDQKDDEIDEQYNETFTSVLGKEQFEENRIDHFEK